MSSIAKSTTPAVANDPVESRQKFAAIADGQYEMFAGYPDLLTPKHIAALSGFSVDYVRRLCREHKLPAIQLGSGAWFVPKPKFIAYVMGGNGEVA